MQDRHQITHQTARKQLNKKRVLCCTIVSFESQRLRGSHVKPADYTWGLEVIFSCGCEQLVLVFSVSEDTLFSSCRRGTHSSRTTTPTYLVRRDAHNSISNSSDSSSNSTRADDVRKP